MSGFGNRSRGSIGWMTMALLAERVGSLERKVNALTESSMKKPSGKHEEQLMTSKEVASYLGVTHHKTVERWVRERGLPCVRLGRNLRFRLGDVLRWRAQQER